MPWAGAVLGRGARSQTGRPPDLAAAKLGLVDRNRFAGSGPRYLSRFALPSSRNSLLGSLCAVPLSTCLSLIVVPFLIT